MWLEMWIDEGHGGPGWAFPECLWSPSHKNPSGKSPYWEQLLRVAEGDVVFHLHGKGRTAALVGFSTADSNGYETRRRPEHPGRYEYASSFYRVPLRDFTPLNAPIELGGILDREHDALLDYITQNRAKPRSNRRLIFLVQQGGRLQCQNGAYLSELDSDLARIIFGPGLVADRSEPVLVRDHATTGSQIAQVGRRIGQRQFSDNVKENFGHKCCFPGCGIDFDGFLVGSHIARWSDEPSLRGSTSNGLCLCVLHDKAFELGLFTLTSDLRIHVNPETVRESAWVQAELLPFQGERIRLGLIRPALEALQSHWERVGLWPDDDDPLRSLQTGRH